MKAARLVVLGVAIAAGGLAALLAGGSDQPTAPAPPPVAKLETVEVLTAKADIPMGKTIEPGDLQWRTWPAAAAGETYIRQKLRPDAVEKLAGSIARSSFVLGEPIREAKLLRADGSGFMAAILPSGMRAISTHISPETGAGGFILPNDRVDVILTRRDKVNGVETQTSETILSNIRVLAIDQLIQEKDGEKALKGSVATLEVTQRQAETLALAQQQGALSLTLRSLSDVNAPKKVAEDEPADARKGGINMVRFGVTTTTTK